MIEGIIKEYEEIFCRLEFYDANSWLGKPFLFPLAKEKNPEALFKIHKSFRISASLISHWQGLNCLASESNIKLFEATKNKNNWKIIITGLPTFPKEEIGIPLKSLEGIAGIRIFPKTHHFSFSVWLLKGFLEFMVSKKVPLFLWHTELEWKELYEIAKKFNDLKIVVESQPRKILYEIRSLLALMKECPNIYLEISNLSLNMAIEYLVKYIGAERIIFGTFLPVNDPFVSIGMLIKAQISLEEKKMIAKQNLEGIVNGIHY